MRYFLIQMERKADTPNGLPSWAPRHMDSVGITKFESMGNARRFMLTRVDGTQAALDALDALPGVVELPDTINPARLTRIQNMLATRGIVVDLTGVGSVEAAKRIMAAIQTLVASETRAERDALAALMLSGG